MCGGRSSILHYGPLIETNYRYAPTPNGQSECVAKGMFTIRQSVIWGKQQPLKQTAHISTGHGGRDWMLKHIKEKYANLTKDKTPLNCSRLP